MKKILLFAIFIIVSSCSDQTEYDLIIRNGVIIDGSGSPKYQADIGIKDDKIVSIGELKNFQAKENIDVSNLIVAPGFIDVHTHAVRGIFEVPTAEAFIYQGVTTLTDGNDGSSPFPIGEHYQKIEKTGITPNWAVFIGQGTIREAVMGLENRLPTDAELEKMKQLTQEAMDEGALGLSSGLFYVPGNFSSKEEIIELAKIVGSSGGIYISHMRDEADKIIDSVTETIDIGIAGNLPAHITHHKVIGKENWGISSKTLALVDEANKNGHIVYLDQYPYTASQTSITALIPQWAQAGGRKALLDRLNNQQTRNQIKEEVIRKILFDRGGGNPKNVVISEAKWDTSLEGKNLAEITIAKGLEATPENAAETVFEIIEGGYARAVFHAISDDDVKFIMQHPNAAIASDGPLMPFGESRPHPRSYGTFPRVLSKYVRENKVISLEEAIRKMTSLPAKIISLNKRGLIKEGYYADITIFNPEKISDNATFQDPHQYSTGVEYVIVNGQIVVSDGVHNLSKPGRVLYGPGKVD